MKEVNEGPRVLLDRGFQAEEVKMGSQAQCHRKWVIEAKVGHGALWYKTNKASEGLLP